MYSISNEIVYRVRKIGSITIANAYASEYLTICTSKENGVIKVQLNRFNVEIGHYEPVKEVRQVCIDVDSVRVSQNTNTHGKANFTVPLTDTEQLIRVGNSEFYLPPIESEV